MSKKNLVKCKECEKEVSPKAATCPHCGVKCPGISKKDQRAGCLGATLLLTLFVGMCSLIPVESEKGPVNERNSTKYDAIYYCKSRVKKMLKSPSSADFGYDRTVAQHIGDGKFNVYGSVDSQNGFGAMVRSKFYCSLQRNDEGAWRLEDINIGD